MVDPAPAIPELIAHRGYASRYPENTLPALAEALEAGARYVEFDVQLSGDGVPVLLHDASLARTAGVAGDVTEWPAARLRAVAVGEPARLGDRFAGVTLPTLAEVAALLASWPAATAFVEVKSASLRQFGTAFVVTRVMEAIAPIRERAVVISFDRRAVEAARRRGARAIGWVIRTWDDATRRSAEALRPEYLFCRHDRLPAAPAALWPGPWRWAVYDVDSASMALELAARGADLVETMCIGELLRDPRLAGGDSVGR